MKTTLKFNGICYGSVVRSLLVAFMLMGGLLFSGSSFGQIALRGTATTNTTTGTALTINKPTGLAVNDIMLANITQSNNNSNAMSNATRTGWTLISGNLFASNGSDRWHMTVLYKIADAADVAASNYAFTLNANSDDGVGGIVAFSGVNTATPLDLASTFNSGNSSTATATGLTTVTANAAIIMFESLGDNQNISAWNTTSPGTLAELFDEDFNATADMSAGAAWANKSTIGATGNGTGTIDASERWGAVMVALRPVTIATSAITGSPFCAGNNVSVPYTIAGPFGATNTFTAQLSNAAGSFASPTVIGSVANTNTAGTINATIPTGQAAGTGYKIRVVSTSPAATGTESATTITVNVLPTASAGTAVSTCSTSGAVNITAGSTAANQASVTWTSSGTGTFANANSLTTATYTPSAADIIAGSVTLTLTAVANSPCSPNATSNKTLTILAPPTASAGGSQTICQNGTAVVSGASASGGTISWSENGAGSITAGGTTLTPTYTAAAGDAGNTVTLTMTVTNAGCAVTAAYSVLVNGSATAVAGTAVSTCVNSGPVGITAGSSATNNAGITWTHNGTGSIDNPNSLTTATYTPGLNETGNVTLTLTATGNAPCVNAISNKTLTIVNQPTASAGGSTTICQNQTAVVSGASSSNGTISWSENGAGSITAGGTTLTPTYTAAAGDAGNTVTLTMTVTNNPCTPATATYTVNVLPSATAVAGTAVSVCTNDSVNITAGSSASNNTSVAWTHNGTGSIADANSLTLATYTPGPGEVGNVTLTLTATGNTPCGNVTSNKTLTINAIPSTTGAVICQGEAGEAMTSSTVCPDGSSQAASEFPASGTNSGAGTAWTAPGNILGNDNSNASVSGQGNAFAQTLNAGDFGFSLPANASIGGIQVTMGRFRSGGIFGEIQDNSVRLLKAGSAVGTNKAATSTNWPASEAAANYGATNDLWGTTWTAADVNASNFGVALIVDNTSGFSSRTANVDYISVTVTYTVPGDIHWYTVSSGGTLIGTGSSFNPVGVAGSGLADTNTPGTTTYYAECSTVAGCRTPTTFTINPLPTVSFTGLAASYCSSDAAVTLTGNEAVNSLFAGAGITNNGGGTASFNPTTAGAGTHTIAYSYVNENGCANNAFQDVTVIQADTYYADADGDGFGNPNVTEMNCTGPSAGFVADNTDCDDNALQYLDADGDGFGSTTQVACGVTNNIDCDDNQIQYLDNDSDGFGSTTQVACGVTNNTDCDDNDIAKNATFEFYVDADGDTYGTGDLVFVCAVDAVTPPANYSMNNTDCNDGDNAIFQSGTLFVDADNDGYNNGTTQIVCYGASVPSGYVAVDNGLDCNDAIFAINPGHAEVLYNGIDDNCDGNLDEGFQYTTQVFASQCGTTLTTINSFIVVASKAHVTMHRFEVTNMSDMSVQYLERTQNYFSPTMLASNNYETTYSVRCEIQRDGVWLGYYGPSCLVSTPAVLVPGGAATISPTQCGGVLPTISTLIATTSLANVTGYRFQVTNASDPFAPNQVQIIDRAQFNWFALTMLSTYTYGTTYFVQVSIKTNGVYSPFGSPCAVTSPAAPMLANCGATIATKGTLVSAASLDRVTSYRFKITNFLNNQVTTLDRSQNWFTFNNVPGFMPGAEYGVEIAVMTSGVFSPFGEGCSIFAPATARTNAEKPTFNAVAYPNPFADSFGIKLTTSAEDNVNVKVYDMTGRMLESTDTTILDMQTLQVGSRYPAGVYNIVVSQGTEVKTLRVIKR